MSSFKGSVGGRRARSLGCVRAYVQMCVRSGDRWGNRRELARLGLRSGARLPLARPVTRRGGGFLYCLVLELADGGTVADYFERAGKPWSSARA
ncbi:MAG: hypothetical protein KDB80_05405, partial [Planctomycetes bacterium]|nr:hypothetical protein [Planctomycetota bacterium]